MYMDRFIDGPLEPTREQHIQAMLDEVQIGRATSSVGNQATAYVAGFIAINYKNPLITKDLEGLLETSFIVATRAANSLDKGGFINRKITGPKINGKKASKLLIPEPELYEAIAITPDWQRATRICVLATELGLTVGQAIDTAIRNSLDSLEIEGKNKIP